MLIVVIAILAGIVLVLVLIIGYLVLRKRVRIMAEKGEPLVLSPVVKRLPVKFQEHVHSIYDNRKRAENSIEDPNV